MRRYAVDPANARTVCPLDGYTLLYHRPSGTTHVLAPPAPELIAALAAGPADLAGIVARLAAAHELDAEEDLAATVAARLEELIAAGLVRAA